MLSHKSLTEDLLVYGYVIGANSLRLKVILPGGFTGYVDPTHVSNAYSDKLKHLLNSEDEEPKVENIHNLFPVGSFVVCKLINPKANEIKLSLNPKDINQDIFSSQIKANMILIGSVNSVEDHGYIIDFGIMHISAFLHNKDAKEHIEIFNEGKPLCVGQQLRCLVLSAPSDNQKENESRTVKVTIDPFAVDSAVMKSSMNLSYTSIQPGLKTEVKIVKAQKHGLDIKFQNYEGTIPKVYWNLSEKKFKADSMIEATVVYVDHKQKLLMLSLLTHYHNPVTDLFPNYKVGQTKTGIVQSVNNKIGIYLGLPKGILGLADLQGLSSKGSSSMEEAYAVGSEHKCRVIGFLPVENSVQVSVKSIENDTKFLTIKDIIPGVLITCHVKKLFEKGVLVSINDKLAGLIPSYHVDDDITKSPEELFNEGDQVTCRILSIHLKSNKVFLTCKRSLVETKLPVVFRFDQIKEDMLLEGFIKSVNDNGAVIAFYGDLTIWLPHKCFKLDPGVLLTSVYKVGRLIKCRVSKVIPEEEKFFIILPECARPPKTTPNVTKVTMETIKTFKRVPIAIDIPAPEVGELTKCILYKKTEKSFNCFLIPSKKSALIPKMHLSDCEEMCEKMWNNYQPNQILDAVIFEKTNNFIVASCKQTLIKVANDKIITSSFEELKVGQILIGVVQNVADYGLFVEFPGHIVGLARKKFISHQNNLVIDNYFKPGMTVQAKVIEVKKDVKKFCVSLLIADVGIEPKYGLKLLRRTFKENKEFAKVMKQNKGSEWLLKNLTVGTLCSVAITAVSEKGASCILKNGAKGFVPKTYMEGQELKKGMTVNALIIDVDHASNSVQLCSSSTITLYAKKRESKLKPVPANTVMESIVLLNKANYVLLMLTTKVKGQLAYLCPKIHENDVTSGGRFHINQQLKVQYVKNIRNKVVVTLAPEDEMFSKMKVPAKKKKSKPTKKKKAAFNKENLGKDKQKTKVVNGSAASPTITEKKAKKRKAEEESVNKIKTEKKLKKNKRAEIEEKEENDSESDTNNKVLAVMPPVFFDWDETPHKENNRSDDSSEDEMSQDETDNASSKKSKKAKLKEHHRKEEQRLYEIERKRLEGENQLETAEDFDCLVLNSPNSSLLWLRYMAFHLETAEIDKARQVAERALKTIGFREEQEKFNVWVAYLNLENLYGTKEKLTKVLEQALKQNPAIKVYQQLVNIYVKSGKIQEAEDVHHILLKRFRSDKSVWVNYSIFCYKNANLEEGRKLIERAIKSLDKKDHVSLIVKIAQLEFKYGEVERGKTMFENIVSNFPKRTDLWSIYIDMTIQQADYSGVRDLFERVTNLRLSARKMKFFFKKYLDFEQKHGTPELVMGVRKKALEYVEDSHETESDGET